jgi:fibronectin-binding autotransporter adhesin
VTLTGLQDNEDEQDETVVVSVTNITNGTAAPPQSVTATLADNDSALFAVSQGRGGEGRVNVYDATGALVRTFVPFVGWTGEVRVTTGDVTGDETKDIVVGTGAGASGHVKVFDGQTGAEIRSFFAFEGFNGGISVAAGDIDNDGRADIIVGAGAGAPSGHVKAFSGQDNSLLRSFLAFEGFAGGVTVAAGDIDGDKRSDIIVGSAAPALPHVKVFSGADTTLLRSFFAFDAGSPGGVQVGAGPFSFQVFAPDLVTLPGVSLASGDVNGDGRAEIVVGSGRQPVIRVFDGATGGQISGLTAFPGFAAGVTVGTNDRDADGLADILVGVGPSGAGGHVRAFDGVTLPELASFLTFDANFVGGVFVG